MGRLLGHSNHKHGHQMSPLLTSRNPNSSGSFNKLISHHPDLKFRTKRTIVLNERGEMGHLSTNRDRSPTVTCIGCSRNPRSQRKISRKILIIKKNLCLRVIERVVTNTINIITPTTLTPLPSNSVNGSQCVGHPVSTHISIHK